MLHVRPLAFLFGLAILGGCAAGMPAEEMAGTDSALSGRVAEGTIVKTVTDGLRLRKLPVKDNTKNVIGLIPIGTTVKVLEGEPMGGFYKVEVVDEPIRSALATPIGWVFGEYLTGQAEEAAEPESLTGTHDEPTVMRVKFVLSDCKALKDDKGKPMGGTIDDFLLNGGTGAVAIGIDTNTFSYGMRASIDEVDQPSSFNPGGKSVPLKVMKTAKTQPSGGFTVTLCAEGTAKVTLPTDADGRLTLKVFPN